MSDKNAPTVNRILVKSNLRMEWGCEVGKGDTSSLTYIFLTLSGLFVRRCSQYIGFSKNEAREKYSIPIKSYLGETDINNQHLDLLATCSHR